MINLIKLLPKVKEAYFYDAEYGQRAKSGWGNVQNVMNIIGQNSVKNLKEFYTLGASKIKEWVVSKKIQKNTAEAYWTNVNVFATYICEILNIKYDDKLKKLLPKIKYSKKKKKGINDDVWELLDNFAKERKLNFKNIWFFYRTNGIRISEIHQVNWNEIKPNEWYYIQALKNNNTRPIIATESQIKTFRHHNYHTSYITILFNKFRKAFIERYPEHLKQVSTLTVHSLRAKTITNLYKGLNADVEAIKKFTGHKSSFTIIDTYVRYSDSETNQILDKIKLIQQEGINEN